MTERMDTEALEMLLGNATPGPWFNCKVPGYLTYETVCRFDHGAKEIAGDCPIASVHRGKIGWEHKFPVKANARLIAAAPTLAAEVIALRKQVQAADAAMDAAEWDDGGECVFIPAELFTAYREGRK